MPAYTVESATSDAFVPFGSSRDAAVAVAVAYAAFQIPAAGNLLVTKYAFYDALLVSIACKSETSAESSKLSRKYRYCSLLLVPTLLEGARRQRPLSDFLKCCAVRIVAFSCRAVYLTPGGPSYARLEYLDLHCRTCAGAASHAGLASF